MTLHHLKTFSFYLTAVTLLVLSANTHAVGWVFNENKGENCVVLSSVFSVMTQNRIANIGILKISSSEIDKISESERDLFLNGLSFVVETKGSFKPARGVGIQITSKSLNVSLSYRENTTPKNEYYIYTSSNADSLDIVGVLMNNEDLTIEFNTPSSGIEYGLVSAKDFKKYFNEFDTCSKSLE